MHDHNLDDLIIDNIEPKNSKIKSFLTIIALLIVVLIVAIVLTRILLKAPDHNPAFAQDATELIAPELKLKETQAPSKAQPEPLLSSIVKEESKTPTPKTKKEVEVKPLKVVEQKKEPALSNITQQEIKAPIVEIKKPVSIQESNPVIKEKSVQETVTAKVPNVAPKEKIAEKKIQETIQTIEPVKPKKAEVLVVQKPKPIIAAEKKRIVPKTVKKPYITPPAPKVLSTKKYYIQVGSFKAQPSVRFVSVIKNNGYKYITTRPTANGTKKLLIGPYKDRPSVDRALLQIRDRITKRAFVVTR